MYKVYKVYKCTVPCKFLMEIKAKNPDNACYIVAGITDVPRFLLKAREKR